MKNTWNDFVKPIVVLGVICLVTSLLLAVTNNVTAPIIAENAVKTANATRQALLPSADTFTEVAPETPTEGVTAIYKADNDSGYVITAQAKGYGGEVPVMVAFNAEGTIDRPAGNMRPVGKLLLRKPCGGAQLFQFCFHAFLRM